MSRRKRHGRFRRDIRRFTEQDFARALQLFVETPSVKPDEFRPAGLPGYGAMQQRCARYPEFAEKFVAARKERIGRLCAQGIRGPWAGKGRKHSTEAYDALLKAIETSECSCKSHFYGRPDYPPELPNFDHVRSYIGTHQEFADRYIAVLAAKGWATGKRGTRSFWPGAYRTPDRVDIKAAILSRMRTGQSIAALWSDWRANGTASKDVVQRWLKTDPEFAREVREIRASAAYVAAVRKRRAAGGAQATGAKPPTSEALVKSYLPGQLKGKLLQNTLFAAAEAAVKATRRPLQETDRLDIISNMIEAALAGEIEIEDMADEAPYFISEHSRQWRSYKALSLDKKIGDEDGMTHLDQLSTGEYGFAD